ncbi:MAG: hypothetical protein JWN86_2505 [Planctomycetota bacterium]|nr:hypothetical protein [Planctomycetota bacterium]
MSSLRTIPLAALYTEDETAWLDRMSELARYRSLAEFDFDNLSEYLSDMARRDRVSVRWLGVQPGGFSLLKTMKT